MLPTPRSRLQRQPPLLDLVHERLELRAEAVQLHVAGRDAPLQHHLAGVVNLPEGPVLRAERLRVGLQQQV